MLVNRMTTLCATLLLAACGTNPSNEAAIEQHRGGTGPRVVVFQSGLGDGLDVWRAVQTRTDAVATTFSFSRPGYGRSRATGGERSPCRAAEEQRALLQSAGLAPPYVLVGHSLGGLYQYAFALLYPNEVAGLVLLDPTHPEHWAAMQSDTPAMATLVKVARARFSDTMRREFDGQAACLERLQTSALPRMPVRLLVRGEFRGLEAGTFESVVHRLEADWARRLGVAAPIRIDRAGHYLQRERPQQVSETIASVVNEAARR
jgi:pimeloyl-ACP methyl ester carboxylesterase